MDYKKAVSDYKSAAGNDFQPPSEDRSYMRDGAVFLLDASGVLLCVVAPDGTASWGVALNRAWQQFQRGLPGA